MKNAVLEKRMLSFGQFEVFVSIVLVGNTLVLFLDHCHRAHELGLRINEAFIALADSFTFLPFTFILTTT